ncbi:MAG: hypothetical protein A3G49_04045 [Candidatus Sungbacteria bacterium RIFCSPLOWO2_12_FULL_41_11]|uniref:Non-canonical purine NTP pyrophosphatase n=1 Tax=Candidatus Sungbacteria bacterium RIFCSPLOWO2_12_FULL_41_11 TaxID=1802286 RepID=A0A1G2LT62_9BACT|nr:MAG: Non-canonical purine NTP pyrophosphatase [Parcubacteria group bacterium GW2011_GWA2_42_14]OHA14835.1 MAG: hypothetical protein A3G49_04045 [Candidatus Sungbacteria bacterium RIFCSPLOWO2_12_FULL_41_11]
MIKQLLLATTNPGKVTEYKVLLGHLPIDLVSLKEAGITMAVEEDGKTFEENSIKKAAVYHGLSGLPTLADDGGLEIDHLGGEPGVMSRRWPGYEASDEELIKMALDKLNGVPREKRGAKLKVSIALIFPEDNNIYTAEGEKRGFIGTEPVNFQEGYPFRCLFYIPELGKYYSELTLEEEAMLAHRKEAIDKIMPILKEKLM